MRDCLDDQRHAYDGIVYALRHELDAMRKRLQEQEQITTRLKAQNTELRRQLNFSCEHRDDLKAENDALHSKVTDARGRISVAIDDLEAGLASAKPSGLNELVNVALRVLRDDESDA